MLYCTMKGTGHYQNEWETRNGMNANGISTAKVLGILWRDGPSKNAALPHTNHGSDFTDHIPIMQSVHSNCYDQVFLLVLV